MYNNDDNITITIIIILSASDWLCSVSGNIPVQMLNYTNNDNNVTDALHCTVIILYCSGHMV